MFDLKPKQVQAMAPLMQRVLVVDHGPASVKLIAELLRNIGHCQVWSAPDVKAGLGAAEAVDPRLIFVEYDAEHLDGMAFTRRLRRSHLACRKAPVIMVTSQATPAVIMAARDAGVHEFLRRPFTIKDLVRRLEAVSLQPRGWVEAIGYVGPDRRRFNSADYKGAKKRKVDSAASPEHARLAQALRIIASAQAALATDRPQALRALNAQAEELKELGRALQHGELFAAATALQDYLAIVGRTGGLSEQGLGPHAARLLAFLPADEGRPRDAAA